MADANTPGFSRAYSSLLKCYWALFDDLIVLCLRATTGGGGGTNNGKGTDDTSSNDANATTDNSNELAALESSATWGDALGRKWL